MNVQDKLLTKPNHVVSLATSCLLVTPVVHVWTATMQDSEISEEVTAAKKADKDSGKFVKNLLAKNSQHKKILIYRQTVYNWMQMRTYDWAGKQRILPVIGLTKFMTEWAHHETAFKKLVDDFLDAYPNIVSNMAFVQGDIFNRDDYPTVDEVCNKFSINLYTAEVPIGDYRCQIATDLAEDLQNHYERQAKGLVENILTKQKTQLIEVMTSIARCCTVDTVVEANGEVKVKRKKLFDSTLQRAIELCDTFSEFNLTNDSDLDMARISLVKVLDGITIDKLRDSDTARVVVKEGIEDILAKFGI